VADNHQAGRVFGESGQVRVVDAVALVVGIVVGAGIFRTPSVVAAQTASDTSFLLVWLVGGLVSVAGALCYAELSSAFPHRGGDYHFLHRALGPAPAFLFAWARLTVIPTGSIALLAFVFGDYATQLFSFGTGSSTVYAATAVLGLTVLNVAGLHHSRLLQNSLTLLLVVGLCMVVGVGLLGPAAAAPTAQQLEATAGADATPLHASLGLAMVFVLLTYGGWNEAAYLSADVKGGRRPILKALLWGLGIITALYILTNLAYLRGLGHAGMASSEAVAADLMQRSVGVWGATVISVLVAVSALTSGNATVLLGARTSYALGRDFPLLAPLGRWNERAGAPVNALLLQGAMALALVGLGGVTRKGFETMVEYTAPVFWLFFLLTAVSVFVLRIREPDAPRPFRVPLYPLTPLLFCATCAYLLHSSIAYTGVGALFGLAVLGLGVPLWLFRGFAGRKRVQA
jgi:basic amino acid/polyamine antiporter, APA family